MGPHRDVFHASRRRIAGLLLLVASLVTLGAACGDDTDTSANDTSSTTSTTPDSSTTTAGDTTTTAEKAPTLVEVVVSDGRVEGDVKRRAINLGDEVILRVTSDVADEVHVHGYDLKKDVEAGDTVEITFVADLAGVWEAELEEHKILLVELQVS